MIANSMAFGVSADREVSDLWICQLLTKHKKIGADISLRQNIQHLQRGFRCWSIIKSKCYFIHSASPSICHSRLSRTISVVLRKYFESNVHARSALRARAASISHGSAVQAT